MTRRRVSIIELRAQNILAYAQFPDPVAEHQFHPVRKWRFDLAYPDRRIAIECEGAVWTQGRHTRGSGFTSDTEKYNAAVILGWRVLRYTMKTLVNLPEDLRAIWALNPAETSQTAVK